MAKVSLRTGQYKRLGRLSAKNPDKAGRVAERMVERRSRVARGSEFLKKNVDKLYPEVPTIGKKGTKVVKKAKSGASLKPVDSSKNPGLAKLPTPVRNKMGYQKNGGKVKTAKGGAALKKQAATAIAMKKAGKAPKKMMGGGKCKYGC
jgi:hypothetical protein